MHDDVAGGGNRRPARGRGKCACSRFVLTGGSAGGASRAPALTSRKWNVDVKFRLFGAAKVRFRVAGQARCVVQQASACKAAGSGLERQRREPEAGCHFPSASGVAQ